MEQKKIDKYKRYRQYMGIFFKKPLEVPYNKRINKYVGSLEELKRVGAYFLLKDGRINSKQIFTSQLIASYLGQLEESNYLDTSPGLLIIVHLKSEPRNKMLVELVQSVIQTRKAINKDTLFLTEIKFLGDEVFIGKKGDSINDEI